MEGKTDIERIAALEARCQELEDTLDSAGDAFNAMTILVSELAIRLMVMEGQEDKANDIRGKMLDFQAMQQEMSD